MPYQYRKSPRANWYEYNDGLYFVTVCTKHKRYTLGQIHNGIMNLTEIGEFLAKELCNPNIHHQYVKIFHHVVMPNHFHVMVGIDASKSGEANDIGQRMVKALKDKRLPLLSKYIGAVKAAVTRFANNHGFKFGWQPRFHDHIIRSLEEQHRIAEYIENNVERWSEDCFCADFDE